MSDYEKLLAWCDNYDLEEELEEAEIIETEYIPPKELDAMDLAHFDKKDAMDNLKYHLLNGFHTEENTYQKANYWKDLDGKIQKGNNICFNIVHHGDSITKTKMKVPLEVNINELLSCKIQLASGGSTFFQSTIRLSATLAEMFLDRKIKKTDTEWIIPLFVFEFLSTRRIDTCRTVYHQKQIFIYNPPHEDFLSNKIRLSVCYGFYDNDLRGKQQTDGLRLEIPSFLTYSRTINVDSDYIIELVGLHNRAAVLIIWNEIDITNFAENQLLQPNLVGAKLDLGFIQKEIDINEIKTIKIRNYLGFIVPTNTLKWKQIAKFLEGKTDKNLMKNMIRYSHIANYPHIHLQFDNYQPGSKLVIERCEFETVVLHSGMTGIA